MQLKPELYNSVIGIAYEKTSSVLILQFQIGSSRDKPTYTVWEILAKTPNDLLTLLF